MLVCCVCGADASSFVCVRVQHMGLFVRYITVDAGVRAPSELKPFQESARRTRRLCNLWLSKDFQLSASSCMATQQRDALPNYKGVKSGCVTLITCRLLTLYFMSLSVDLYSLYYTLNGPDTDSYGTLGCL